MSHAHDPEEVASELGIKLPKQFDEYDPESVGQLKPADALRLAAGCIVRRETNDAMRYASDVREDVAALACVRTAPGVLVDGWKRQVAQLVAAGKRADDVQKELGIPEFLAATLVRICRREAREAKETAAKKTAAKGKK
jgi:hypothetical protein